MAQKSTAAAAVAVAVAVAVASFQMVGGKCLIPWRAPPCVGRGRRIYICMILYTYIHILNEFQPICINNCWITLYPNPSIGKAILFFQPILEEF